MYVDLVFAVTAQSACVSPNNVFLHLHLLHGPNNEKKIKRRRAAKDNISHSENVLLLQLINV